MEVIFPCSKEELGDLMNFLNEGKINCNKKIDGLNVVENLNKILGFPAAKCIEIINNIIYSDKEDAEESVVIEKEVKASDKV